MDENTKFTYVKKLGKDMYAFPNKDCYLLFDFYSNQMFLAYLTIGLFSIIFGLFFLCLTWKAEPLKQIKVKHSFLIMIPVIGGIFFHKYFKEARRIYIEHYKENPCFTSLSGFSGEF